MTREEAIHILDNLKPTNTKSSFDAYVVGKAITMAIQALEYDDAKYHEEHGEVVVDKAVWEDAKKALEQEPCRDMEEIAEVINCDADAETKCKMISNILTAKPHYFEEQEPKTGHCKDCKHFRKLPYHADALGKCIHHGGFCPKGDWYCADFEPQEGE